jgi:hypothetical protein
MFVDEIFGSHGFFLKLLTLSDPTFYHLLGLLAVLAFLRLFVPLHFVMVRELLRRNEIADLAEEEHCNEYDIFVKAHKFYYGSEQPEKIKLDFITYLYNWPDNYILPFYLRIFLEELKRDNTDSKNDSPNEPIKKIRGELPNNSTP